MKTFTGKVCSNSVLKYALVAWSTTLAGLVIAAPFSNNTSEPHEKLLKEQTEVVSTVMTGNLRQSILSDTSRRPVQLLQKTFVTANSYANVSSNCATTTPIPTGCIRIVSPGNEPFNFSNSEPTLPGSSDAQPFWTIDNGFFTVRPCIDETNASSLAVTSPIFRAGTSDKFFTPDDPGAEYTPENGWVLAYKDFGVQNSDGSTKGPALPFFALYNKYRGVLRVFVYNPSTGRLTRNHVGFALKQWKLNGAGQLKLSALLSHGTTDPNYVFYEPYEGGYADCNPVLPVAISTNRTDGWVFADFDLAGYDPGNSQTVFELSISDFEQASFSGSFSGALNGDGTFTGELGSGGPGGSFTNWGAALSGVSSTVKNLSSIVNLDPDKTALNFLTGVINPGGGVGQILQLANTLNALFQDRQPQKLTGTLRFSGKLGGNITGQILAPGTYSRAVYLGITNDLAYDQTPGLYRTLNNIKWGIYSLRRPNHQLSLNINGDYFYNGAYYRSTQGTIQTPINPSNLILNPELGMTLVNSEVSYIHVYPDGNQSVPATGFVPAGTPATVVSVLRSSQGYYDEFGNFQYDFINLIPYTPNAYILRLTFRTPNGKTSILTKVYPLPDDVQQQLTAYLNEGYSSARRAAPAEKIDVDKSVNIYPNPFDQSATIEYEADKGGQMEYKVLDLTGRVIQSDKFQVEPGKKQFIWNGTTQNGRKVSSGVYLIELNVPGENGQKRIVRKLIKQ